MINSTPTAIRPRPTAGTQRGLGFGLGGLGGVYVDRLDFDRGTAGSSAVVRGNNRGGWYRSTVTPSHDISLDITTGPQSPRGGVGLRIAFGLTVALLAAILVVAAQADAAPSASRTGRRVELVELIRGEQARTRTLEATVAELASDVARFESAGAEGAQRLERVQTRIDRLLAPAGLTAVRGPGVVTVLTDSALEESPTGNLNDLVIHEQDLQAVINALWAGGAEAMSVNGQRILATTAIRCVGNTLLLHGAVYSPPYVIQTIGDQVALQSELDRDPVVERFRAAAAEYKLGFAVTVKEQLALPAYDGPTAMAEGEPVEGTAR